MTCRISSEYMNGVDVMLMLPFGIHWSEAVPDDFLDLGGNVFECLIFSRVPHILRVLYYCGSDT